MTRTCMACKVRALLQLITDPQENRSGRKQAELRQSERNFLCADTHSARLAFLLTRALRTSIRPLRTRTARHG